MTYFKPKAIQAMVTEAVREKDEELLQQAFLQTHFARRGWRMRFCMLGRISCTREGHRKGPSPAVAAAEPALQYGVQRHFPNRHTACS